MYTNYPIFAFMAPGFCIRHRKAFPTPRLFLKSKKHLFFPVVPFFKKALKCLIHEEFVSA